ncbi:MAG: hypothetical protein PHV33_05710 [Elusimicrobiales bacterium]|nr:hypothetical protein [Elusimicrobiales bacterium]
MKTLKDLLERCLAPGPGGISACAAALFAAALAAYAVTVCTPPAFEPVYSLYLDSVSFYWIQALWDRGLFAGDRLAAFYLSHLKPYHPEALWIWFTALFMKVRPYTLGLKALAVLGCAAAALLVRRLALASPGPRAAGAAALLFTLLFLSMDTFFGVPRLYGALALLGFAAALEERRFLLLPWLTALCFVVYPSAAVGVGFTSALVPVFFRADFSARRLLGRYLAHLAGAAALCLLLLNLSGLANNAGARAAQGPEFQAAKLYQRLAAQINPANPAEAAPNLVLNLNEHAPLYAIFLALLALLYGLGLLAAPGRPAMLPRAVPALLAGCGAAFIVLYPLHPVSASRQLAVILPLALVFLGAEALLLLGSGRFRAGPAAAVCAALFAVLHPLYNETTSVREFAGAYEFLAAAPGGLAAAYPEGELNLALPVFTGKAVLVSSDLKDQELLFLGGGDYEGRRSALLAALYCAAPGAGEALAAYGVRWLVFEKKYYGGWFVDEALQSRSPLYEGLPELLAGRDPAACYEAGRASAAYSWPGGFVLDLAPKPL